MIVVVALQREGAKETLNLAAYPSLAHLTWPGLVGRAGTLGGHLQQMAHARVGRLEDGRAYQHLQFLHQGAGGGLACKARHQLRDLLFPRQEEFGRGTGFLFLGPPPPAIAGGSAG